MEDVGEMVRRYGGMVWAIVYRVLGEHGAEDCFQEVFVAAMEVAKREKVWSWEGMLRRLAVAKGVDALRRRVRERGRMAVPVEWEEVAGREVLPAEAAEKAELLTGLRRALTRIPEQQAETFLLRYVTGMSYEEIGAAMGITGNAAGVMLMRAKGRLRELMERPIEQGEVKRE